MTMMKRLTTLLACAAILPLAFVAPGAAAQTPAEPVAAPAEVEDVDPALWVVKDADTTIYLFGTVHMLKPGLGWFDEAVKDAFDKSQTLVLEVVLPEDQAEMMTRTIPLAMDKNGKPLSSLLSDEQRTAYEAAMNKYGLPAGNFDIFEPWFPGMTLAAVSLMAEGYSPDLGSEKVLTAAAKAASKEIKGLETLEEQLGFFDGLPPEAQLKFLNDTVAQLPTASAEFSEILFAWARGNPDDLAVRMNRSMSGSEALAEALLFTRNARWADWIKARLEQPGAVFVAVGAGHLAGERSVQDYLAKQGLTAERISY
jgi:uncharacterized protein